MIIRRYILLLLLFVGVSNMTYSQENMIEIDRPVNGIGLSLFGDASVFSANYERLFQADSNFILSAKIGVGRNEEFRFCAFGPCATPPETYLTIPHHITTNFGRNRHFFELGVGGTVFHDQKYEAYVLYSVLGYRLIPLQKQNLYCRVHIDIPLSGLKTIDILFVPAGLNVGFCF